MPHADLSNSYGMTRAVPVRDNQIQNLNICIWLWHALPQFVLFGRWCIESKGITDSYFPCGDAVLFVEFKSHTICYVTPAKVLPESFWLASSHATLYGCTFPKDNRMSSLSTRWMAWASTTSVMCFRIVNCNCVTKFSNCAPTGNFKVEG